MMICKLQSMQFLSIFLMTIYQSINIQSHSFILPTQNVECKPPALQGSQQHIKKFFRNSILSVRPSMHSHYFNNLFLARAINLHLKVAYQHHRMYFFRNIDSKVLQESFYYGSQHLFVMEKLGTAHRLLVLKAYFFEILRQIFEQRCLFNFLVALEKNGSVKNFDQTLINVENGSLEHREFLKLCCGFNFKLFFWPPSIVLSLDWVNRTVHHLLLFVMVFFDVSMKSWVREIGLSTWANKISALTIFSCSAHRRNFLNIKFSTIQGIKMHNIQPIPIYSRLKLP